MIIIGEFYTNCDIYLGGTKKKRKERKTVITDNKKITR